MRAAGLVAVLALLLADPAFAAPDASTAEPTLEPAIIMRVDTQLTIEPGGAFGDLKIETPLDPALKAALEKAVRGWHFKPVLINGVPRRASTSMRIVLAALGEGEKLRIVVDSVDFPTDPEADVVTPDGELAPIAGRKLSPPRFPPEEQHNGTMGKVLLGILVTPDGRAAEVSAMQSMIFKTREASEKSIRRSLRAFEAVAIASAKRWTFNVPAGGPVRTNADMSVAVAVQFSMGPNLDAAGEWFAVVRLPKQELAWLPPAPNALNLGVASATGGGISSMTSAFGLSTDVVGTALQ